MYDILLSFIMQPNCDYAFLVSEILFGRYFKRDWGSVSQLNFQLFVGFLFVYTRRLNMKSVWIDANLLYSVGTSSILLITILILH